MNRAPSNTNQACCECENTALHDRPEDGIVLQCTALGKDICKDQNRKISAQQAEELPRLPLVEADIISECLASHVECPSYTKATKGKIAHYKAYGFAPA